MLEVHPTNDPAEVLGLAGGFLASRPVEHNLVLSLLTDRVARGTAGHYWWLTDSSAVVGVGFQSPTSFSATITPMARDHVDALVERIDVTLPGVIAEAATAAAFAGAWTQRHAIAARPVEAGRLHRLHRARHVGDAPGRRRAATEADLGLIEQWLDGFTADTGPSPELAAVAARGYVEDRTAWLWEDDGPACLVRVSPVVAGVARVGPVYTPPARRGRGYATTCVAELSRSIEADTNLAILHTQLENPSANAMYRRIGYRPVLEMLRYEFVPRVVS